MKPPARLVWIIDQLGPGGAERMALRFAALPLRWRVELVALHGRAGEPAPGVELDRDRLHFMGMRGLADASAWWRLLQLLARWRPVLVHTHLRYATIWGAAAAELLRRPFVSTVHSGPPVDVTRTQRWAAACELGWRRRAARVVYVSAAQKQAWGAVACRERAVVIGHGVALPAGPSRAAHRSTLALPPQAQVFLTVAVVRAPKGWRTWLAAVERIAAARPEALFIWVGGGPDWERLRSAVSHSPAAARILLPGPSAEVGGWLAASDMFLFPSEQEAQPTAVIEAMAAGLPVIASRLPAIEEVLQDCGRLVPVANPGALAAAALDWSSPDGAPAARAAAASGRQRALGPLSETRWLQRLTAMYEEILAS